MNNINAKKGGRYAPDIGIKMLLEINAEKSANRPHLKNRGFLSSIYILTD